MATKKPAPKKITKTAYVMALPLDMPAKLVVAKAKADGIELSEGHVHNIRSAAKTKTKAKPKAAKAKKASKKAAAPKATAPSAAGTMSKADFVRSQPPDMKAADVVKAARKAGLKMAVSTVYETRAYDRRNAKKAGKKAPDAKAAAPAPVTATKAVAPIEASTGSEIAFRKLVIALGVERATAILADVRRKLDQLVAGG